MATRSRLEMIKQLVTNEKRVVVSNLSETFKVTEETIRRDLEKLELEGVVNRTYGGAVLNAETQMENVHFYKRAAIHMEEKQKIALKTLPLLENKTTIAADSSSTVMETLKLVRNSNEITLLTNSTEIFRQLGQSEINVVSTGGEFNKKSLSLQGHMAKENVIKYHVDILLISCKGLDYEKGALDSNAAEAEIKKLMLEQAQEVVLLADHSKFNKTAFVQLLELKDVDYIVTDKKPDDKWLQFCEMNQIQLIY